MSKLVIIGAGSAMFAKKLIGDLLTFDDMKLSSISLCDINTEKLSVMEKVAKKMVKQKNSNIVIEASPNRRELLKNATYVISTIGVGGVEAYKKDLGIPDKYGVNQNVGDIIGPGGMFRFLRAIPEILNICKDMEELCPDAYFFNYTNPMAPICLTLNHLTKMKVFGFCHNVQSTTQQLSNYLQVDESRISCWAAGIKHMDWFLKYNVDGEDAYPELFRISSTQEGIDSLTALEKDYKSQGVAVNDTVRFKIMHHFGYFVSESPFHMSEYTPYFRKNDEAIKALKVDRRWWLDHEMAADEYFEELKGMLERNEDIPMVKTFEYAPEIIHALESGKPFRANLNVLNRGIISNLPADSVVEVPCYADNMGIHPCYIGEIPDQLAALNRNNINVHRMMAKAAAEKKKDLIYKAVKLDPLTGALLNLDQIHDMVTELINANAEYLKDFE